MARKDMLQGMKMPSKDNSEEEMLDLDMMEMDEEAPEDDDMDMEDDYPMSEDEMIEALEAKGYQINREESEEEPMEEEPEEDMEY